MRDNLLSIDSMLRLQVNVLNLNRKTTIAPDAVLKRREVCLYEFLGFRKETIPFAGFVTVWQLIFVGSCFIHNLVIHWSIHFEDKTPNSRVAHVQ
jgi:hypothetical protein